MKNIQQIIISRVDNLGDIVLTLPVAGVLKELYPQSNITFLGKRYTQPLIEATEHIDRFLDWDELQSLSRAEQIATIQSIQADVILHILPKKEIAQLAKKAGIPLRIGTSHRVYHWLYCNKTIPLGRKNSELHEAQLNLKLVLPLGAKDSYPPAEIPKYYGLTRIKLLRKELQKLLSAEKFNLILHPKSKGSAREWGLDNFATLIQMLSKEKFHILITGTEEEHEPLTEFLKKFDQRVVDLIGKLTLDDLISLLQYVDGIVAASTGPLHIAASLGTYALGLYAPLRPIHPGRWAPIGENADFLVLDKACNMCRKTMDCECIRSIAPGDVKEKLMEAFRRGKGSVG